MTWKQHIDYTCSKVAKNIGIITKARRTFDKETLLSLYYSFIYPYLSYCIHLWGSAYQSYLKKLEILQKLVIRIIAGVNRREHTAPLFSNFGVLTLENVFSYNIGLLMYKYHHGWLSNVMNLFEKTKDIHDHDTRQIILLRIPKFDTDIGEMSFKNQAAHIWNKILTSLNVNSKIGAFKTHLKSFIIETGKLFTPYPK